MFRSVSVHSFRSFIVTNTRFRFFSDDSFFNRKNEKKKLRAFFESPKKNIVVLMGPPSVGKTALLREVLKDFPNSCHVDLRGSELDFSAADSIFSRFASATTKWIETVDLTLPPGLAQDLKTTIKFRKQAKRTWREKFTNLLAHHLNRMGKWNWWDGPEKRPAVFVIDEANRFKDLCTSEAKFSQFVENVLSTCIQYSKQENKVFVVLSTSDSFFMQWLSQLGSASAHIETITLGDLTKPEAKKFYEQQVGSEVANTEFDKIYGVVGGRMLSLIRCALEKPENPEDLPRVQNYYQTLFRLHDPANLPVRPDLPNRLPLCWTKDEFVAVISAIANSKDHAITTNEAWKLITQDGLDSMVAHNVICFRPDSGLASDLPHIHDPHYTFLFPEHVVSAKKFLQAVGKLEH